MDNVKLHIEKMNKRWFIVGLLLVLVGWLTTFVISSSAPHNINRPAHPTSSEGVPPLPKLNAAVVAEGQGLYAQYCAACHGVQLEGQPNWKTPLPGKRFPSPPHDDSGHTWHHADDLLLRIILDGGNGVNGPDESNMPAFKATLSRPQAVAILTYLKSRWSLDNQQYQWEITYLGH